MANPPLTVVMPAHNSEKTISAAIQSTLAQSYPDFELWVLESGSKDRTAEIARSFPDPRLKVFELGSMGFQDVLAYALENARTEWLARMDADDLAFPDRFKKQMDVFTQSPDLVLVGTRCVYLTPFGHIFETRMNSVSREVGYLNMRLPGDEARFFADATVIFRRSVALQVGGYDPDFRMGDVPMWLRMLRHGKGWEMAEPLYVYRLHADSLAYSKVAPSDELYRILVKYAPELVHVHFPEPSANLSRQSTWHAQSYWLRIAAYEALTGDRWAVHKAVDFLEQGESFKKEARLIRWFTHLGRMGAIYYRWHRRNKYRHRPDLEKFFTRLVGPLALSDKFVPAGNYN